MNKSYRYGWQESLAGVLMLGNIAMGFYHGFWIGVLVLVTIAVTHTWMWWLSTQELKHARMQAITLSVCTATKRAENVVLDFIGPGDETKHGVSIPRAIRETRDGLIRDMLQLYGLEDEMPRTSQSVKPPPRKP